jgi:peptidoglycan hydrolase CwlO-like protein
MQDMEVQLKKLQSALDEQRRLVDQLAGELRAQREQLQALQQAPAALLA